jgi:hypothetical protein
VCRLDSRQSPRAYYRRRPQLTALTIPASDPSRKQRCLVSSSETSTSYIHLPARGADQITRSDLSGSSRFMSSARSNRYIFGSWLLDRIMWLLSFYLVIRGEVRRRGSAAR